MTKKQVQKKYDDFLSCESEIDTNGKTLTIYIDGRTSVTVEEITEKDALELCLDLLTSWDFSYRLEFKNLEEAKEYIK